MSISKFNESFVYIGNNDGSNNSTQIFEAFKNSCNNIIEINLLDYYKPYQTWNILDKILYRVKFLFFLKLSIISKLKNMNPKLIVINQFFFFSLLDLLLIKLVMKDTKLIFLTLDSVNQLRRFELFFKIRLKLYDIVCHTKTQDINYYACIEKKTIFFNQGFKSHNFNEFLHEQNYSKKDIDIIFIGNFMPRRFSFLNELMLDPRFTKKRILVGGRGWNGKFKQLSNNHKIIDYTSGDEYYELFNRSKVALIFFNEVAKDFTTTRVNELLSLNVAILSEINPVTNELFAESQLFSDFLEFKEKTYKLLELSFLQYLELIKAQKKISDQIGNKTWDEEIKFLYSRLNEKDISN